VVTIPSNKYILSVYFLLRVFGQTKWDFRDEKVKKFWNTTRQFNSPERAPQVGGQHQIFKIPISKSFALFEKNYLSPNIPRIYQKSTKQPEK